MKFLKILFLGLVFITSQNGFSQSAVNIFESFEDGNIPQGWHLTGFFIDNSQNNTYGGTYSAKSSQGAPPQNNFLRSPKFSVVAGEKMEIQFWAKRSGAGANPWVNVRIKGPVLDYSFDTVHVSSTNGWTAYRFEIDSCTFTDSVHIYFYCNTNPGSQRAHFDDVSIWKSFILPGLPFPPSALSALATSGTEINLSWTDNATDENNYIIERKLDGSAVWNAIDTVADNVTQYTDTQLTPNTLYHYRVYCKNIFGNSPYSNIAFDTTFTITNITINPSAPQMFKLANNYPNPFNPSTKIKFDIPASINNSNVKLSVFDMSGKEVSTLVNGQLNPGSYEFEFSAKNLSSGIYFYRLSTDYFVDTKKMILIK